MKSLFVIVNSDGDILSKQGEWLNVAKLKHAYSSSERDIALNELIERNQKHVDERLFVRECSVDDKGRPKDLMPEREQSQC